MLFFRPRELSQASHLLRSQRNAEFGATSKLSYLRFGIKGWFDEKIVHELDWNNASTRSYAEFQALLLLIAMRVTYLYVIDLDIIVPRILSALESAEKKRPCISFVSFPRGLGTGRNTSPAFPVWRPRLGNRMCPTS